MDFILLIQVGVTMLVLVFALLTGGQVTMAVCSTGSDLMFFVSATLFGTSAMTALATIYAALHEVAKKFAK